MQSARTLPTDSYASPPAAPGARTASRRVGSSQGHGIRDARLGKYLSAWLSADRECTASAPFRQAPSSESDPRAIVDRR